MNFFRRLLLLPVLAVALCASADTNQPTAKILGMYVHQHWPYNHPYAARTWTIEDWRGYADGLKKLGYNAMLIWPVLETMPDPLTPSDRDNLKKIAKVIDILHHEFGMKAYIVLCPNIIANNAEASKATFQQRHFFYCDTRVNPGDPAAMKQMMDWRAQLLAPLAQMDGLTIIDSDPGGYPDSSNEEFVNLLMDHRRVLDTLRPGIELYYWMHAGWRGYGRFYSTGHMRDKTTDAERTETLELLKQRNPAPWGIANGLDIAEKLGIADRVLSFNYGRIEGEPTFPMSNFGGNRAYEGGASPGPRGVMGNAQTHCLQLANTFAFARGAKGQPVTEADYVQFANDLIPGQGETIVRAWKNMTNNHPVEMRTCADGLAKIPSSKLKPGPLKGLLFGSSQRFINDLVMMLHVRAAFVELHLATHDHKNVKSALSGFLTATETWQHQHGYENSLGWAGLEETLRQLNSPEVNTFFDQRFNPWVAPKLLPGETYMQAVARELRDEESSTVRLLKVLHAALNEVQG